MLCVEIDNNEAKGKYYSDPGFPGSTIFAQSKGQKDFSYASTSSSYTKYQATPYYSAGQWRGRSLGCTARREPDWHCMAFADPVSRGLDPGEPLRPSCLWRLHAAPGAW